MLGYNRYLLATTALFVAVAFPVAAQNVPLLTGSKPPNPAAFPADQADINTTIGYINSSGSSGINPSTMAQYGTPRNLLDNGAMNVAQRGTGAITGVSTCNLVGSTQAYVADRWCVNSNVASSAATGQIVTASPSPLADFKQSMNVTRVSGALTVPICAIQEVPTVRSINIAGQQATFSVYLQALAGLNADNAKAANIYIISGTGADQGLQAYSSASTITPTWTGLATTATKALTLTTGWVRYSVSGIVAAGATEVGVMVCFTPAAGSGGSTDGFSMVGAQLEQGTTPSAYEFQSSGRETAEALRYFYRLSENTQSGSYHGFTGLQVTSQNCSGFVSFPVLMRVAPTTTNQLSATTFAILGTAIPATPTALASTFSATVGATSTAGASIKFITGSGTSIVNGNQCMLISANGSGKIDYSADL